MSKHLYLRTLVFFVTMFLLALPAPSGAGPLTGQSQYLCGDAMEVVQSMLPM